MPGKPSYTKTPANVKAEAATDYDAGILSATKDYIERGWRVLPFYRDDGICHLTSEEAEAFTCTANEVSEKFEGYDVGIDVAESDLVDLDVDCPEAAPFIDWVLPPTTTMGRTGKPTSHLLYKRVGEVKYESFKDMNGKELLAVAPKVRLALPPSRHRKTGEPLFWKRDCDPAEIIAADLNKIAGEIAALALITRLWPGTGNHHNVTLALAGTFVRAKWPLEKAFRAVNLISEFTHDPKVDERHEEVKSTYERFEGGDTEITGLPTLATELALAKAPGKAADIEVRLRDWLSVFSEPKEDDQPGSELHKYLLSVDQLLAMKIPDTEYLVDPFLPKPSLSMVFARRGVGKTWLILHLALCLARGVDFFVWSVTKPWRVLLIDGEMPIRSLHSRLKALLGNASMPINLNLLSVALMWGENDSLTINKESDQSRIEDCLAHMEAKGEPPDLIIFDNQSSLMAGVDENSNSDLDDFNRWLVKLRSRGYAVMTVHHAGKDGKQRGASRREDLLDTCIELVEQDGFVMDKPDGASFEIRFSKLRGERPHPDRLCVALKKQEDDGNVVWEVEGAHEIPAYMKVLKVVQDDKPSNQTTLAKQLGMSKQAVYKQVKTARMKGLLTKVGINLTAMGKEEVKKCFGGLEAIGTCL